MWYRFRVVVGEAFVAEVPVERDSQVFEEVWNYLVNSSLGHSLHLFLLCEEHSSHQSHEMAFSLGDDSVYQVTTLRLLCGIFFFTVRQYPVLKKCEV